MAKYNIRITEILSKVVEVEAEDLTSAFEQVDNDYCAERIVLDSGDYVTFNLGVEDAVS